MYECGYGERSLLGFSQVAFCSFCVPPWKKGVRLCRYFVCKLRLSSILWVFWIKRLVIYIHFQRWSWLKQYSITIYLHKVRERLDSLVISIFFIASSFSSQTSLFWEHDQIIAPPVPQWRGDLFLSNLFFPIFVLNRSITFFTLFLLKIITHWTPEGGHRRRVIHVLLFKKREISCSTEEYFQRLCSTKPTSFSLQSGSKSCSTWQRPCRRINKIWWYLHITQIQ